MKIKIKSEKDEDVTESYRKTASFGVRSEHC